MIKGGSKAPYIVFGGLIAIFAIAAMMKRPYLAPFLVIVAAVYDRHIYYGLDSLELTTLLIVLALTAPVFAAAAIRRGGLSAYVVVGSLLLAIGLVAAALGAQDGTEATLGTVRWLLVLNMIVGTAAMCGARPNLTRQLTWWMVTGGAVAAIFGILQRSGKYFLVGPPYADGVYNSTFGYYTNFANFMALASVLGLGLLLELRRTHRRGGFWALAMTVLCAISVVQSLSRGALICMLIGIAVIMFRQVTRPGRFLGILATLGGLGGIIWLVIPEADQTALINRFIVQPGGDVVREQMQAGGMQLATEHPLGIGFNNFQAYVSTGIVDASKALAHSHNTFLQMALDAGWIGFAGFVILTVGACFAAIRAKHNALRLGAGAALIGFLGQVTQDFFFFEAASLTLFGLVLAMSAAKTHVTVQAPEEPPAPTANGANGAKLDDRALVQ